MIFLLDMELVESLDMSVKDCPSKNALVSTLHLTFKKPSSKSADHGVYEMDPSNAHGWNTVGKDNKILKAEQKYLSTSNNVYSSDKGGIKIIYESEDSDESIQCFFEENEQFDITPNLIDVAGKSLSYLAHPKGCIQKIEICFILRLSYKCRIFSLLTILYMITNLGCLLCMVGNLLWQHGFIIADLHPYNLVMENKKIAESETQLVTGSKKGSMEMSKEEETEKSRYNTTNELAGKVGLQQLETKGGDKEAILSTKSKVIQEEDNRANVNKIIGNQCVLADGSSSKSKQEIIEPDQVYEVDEDFLDEEQFKYEYDELIVDDTVETSILIPPAPVYQMEGMNQIMISDDPPSLNLI